MGVELFFVISGFVILMTLERSCSLADFACRRFARLWPPLFLAASITAMVLFFAGPADWRSGWSDYAASVAILDPAIADKLLHRTGTKWVDGSYWSLWVEVRFYVLAALVYLAARKNFVKMWLALFVLSSAAAIFVRHYTLAHDTLALVCFPAFLPYFTIGICAYEIHSGGGLRKLAIAGAVVATIPILYTAARGLSAFAGGGGVVCVVANLMIFALVYAFLVDHRAVRVFKTRPVVALGQASYSLYLIHQVLGVILITTLVKLGMPYLLALPLTIAGIVASAFIMFNAFEMPAKDFILRHTRVTVACIDGRMPWLRYPLCSISAE